MCVRKLGVVLFAVIAIGATMASSASATPTTSNSQWNVAGAKLSGSAEAKCSKASENFSLRSTALGSPLWLTATGIECVSGSKIENATVESADMAVDSETLKFTGVSVMEPSGCSVSGGTITTEPLATNIETDGESVYDKFAPAPGKTKFATVKLAGCAFAGSYSVTGFTRGLLAGKTGEEKADQVFEFNSTSNAVSELKLAGSTATLEGETNNELVSSNNFAAALGAEAQKVVLEPIGGCPEEEGRVVFKLVGETCEYRFTNSNKKEEVEVQSVGLGYDAKCEGILTFCLVSVSVAAGNVECVSEGFFTAATKLKIGESCYVKLEYKWRVEIPASFSSLHVTTKSIPGRANGSASRAQRLI